jgi:hypothetical protein
VVNDVDAEEAQKVGREIRRRAARRGEQLRHRLAQGRQELVAQCVDEFGGDPRGREQRGHRARQELPQDDRRRVGARAAIHAGGTFWCGQEGAMRMRDQGTGGAIVNTVSAAQMGNFGQTNYSAAKGAIASMTYTVGERALALRDPRQRDQPDGDDAHVGDGEGGRRGARHHRVLRPEPERARSWPTCAATRRAGSRARCSGTGASAS